MSEQLRQPLEISNPLISPIIEYSANREETGEMMGVVINLVGQIGEGEVDLILCFPKECRNLIAVLEDCEVVLARGNSQPTRPMTEVVAGTMFEGGEPTLLNQPEELLTVPEDWTLDG